MPTDEQQALANARRRLELLKAGGQKVAETNVRPLPIHKMRPLHRNSLAYLVTSEKVIGGLGYCCVPYFLARFAAKQGHVIADRLGVTTRTVRRARKDWREGRLELCKRCEDAASA